MNYNIIFLFSPIFWVGAGVVLLLSIMFTFKWRVRLGDFDQEVDRFKVRARIASIPYWLLAFTVLALVIIAYMGQGDSRDFDYRFPLGALAVSFVFAIVALGVWKKSFLGYLAAFVLNFVSILGSLIFFLFVTQLPCDGLGCLGTSIMFLILVTSFCIGGLATFLIDRLLSKQINSRGAWHIELIALLISVVLIGAVAVGFMREDTVGLEATKEKFEQFPEGILYPAYLPKTVAGPTYERKDVRGGRFNYVYFIGYTCGEGGTFAIWETPIEGVRDRNYEPGKVESFSGSGSFYAHYAGYGYVLERDKLVITFHDYDCELSQQEIMQIAESMEEKQ